MPKSKLKAKQYGVRVNGILVRKSFYSANEARRWQRTQKEIQDQIRSGAKRYLEPTLLTVAVADFLRARKGMMSFGHQETWLGKYVLPRPAFQGKYLHEITRGEWKKVFGPAGELVVVHGLAPATHNRIRATVHKLYEFARREYEPPRATENPIHDISPLDETRKRPTILEDQTQIRAYIDAAFKDPLLPCWGPYVMTKLNTGLRQQNLIPLRWKDLQGDVLTIREKYVRTKTHHGFLPGSKSDAEERVVGVNTLLKAALEAWRKQTPFNQDEDFIFTVPPTTADSGAYVRREAGTHVSQRQIWDANKRTLEAAKLKYLSEHKLRHSYATHYLESGGNLSDLQRQLFHSTVTTTEIYTHDLKSNLVKRAQAFQVGAPPASRKARAAKSVTPRKDDDET
jgi:integrase